MHISTANAFHNGWFAVIVTILNIALFPLAFPYHHYQPPYGARRFNPKEQNMTLYRFVSPSSFKMYIFIQVVCLSSLYYFPQLACLYPMMTWETR